ncbi:GTPase HflX [Dermatobacter hominis]|uniref:GTPase HflX n=1 Tax=Dermatobacter hominis TaxID=2884263 RepID=UPI001D11E73C|nr:GTPase HflX [Dermatobacter hominis]UDY36815.1 GTPase HflX [Dermatobacter hominis]
MTGHDDLEPEGADLDGADLDEVGVAGTGLDALDPDSLDALEPDSLDLDRLSVGTPVDDDTHRGAFGEFGGESGAFIERTFRERIVLVGVALPGVSEELLDESLDELELLVDTAGADVVARVVQRRGAPDPATYVGSGKAEEIRQVAEATDCDTVVFDDELSPAQQRNLEKLLGRTAIDRTAVILDIFGQNAHSQEGKAQVQLAMFRYRLPRLRGKGGSLSQQAGGVGTRRGPGETQLEIDRRRITRQMHRLEAELRQISRTRETQRKSRRRAGIPNVVIVGYTNAGKSTLLNRLTQAGVLVEDRLFATLDATTRRLQLPGGESVLLTDTVGFVRKLPHQLVEAFRSTLDVANEADLLVHVVDGSAADPEGNIDAVRAVLREIAPDDQAVRPELLVFNKSDRGPGAEKLVEHHPGSVAISAVTGDGVEDLLLRIGDRLRALLPAVDLFVPYDRGDVIAALHRAGEVVTETAEDDGVRISARLAASSAPRFAEFVTGGGR